MKPLASFPWSVSWILASLAASHDSSRATVEASSWAKVSYASL